MIFAACALLFQVANAPLLPLVSGVLAHESKREAAPLIAALIVVPQLMVALLAPWIGERAKNVDGSRCCWLGSPPYQSGVLFALTHNPHALIVNPNAGRSHRIHSGCADTSGHRRCDQGTGRFNLAQGVFGTIMGVGASLSPMLTGLIVHSLDTRRAWLALRPWNSWHS